jgi:hypothetical protein
MAKKKDLKPLFAIKHDFYDSLDNTLAQGINLIQAVESALELDQINQRVVPIVKERLDAFKKALLSTD